MMSDEVFALRAELREAQTEIGRLRAVIERLMAERPARSVRVETSELAARSVNPTPGRLNVLRLLGSGAATCDELERRTEGKHQSLSARIGECRDAGWIVDTGVRRRTRSGRRAVVWAVTPSGRDLADRTGGGVQ